MVLVTHKEGQMVTTTCSNPLAPDSDPRDRRSAEFGQLSCPKAEIKMSLYRYISFDGALAVRASDMPGSLQGALQQDLTVVALRRIAEEEQTLLHLLYFNQVHHQWGCHVCRLGIS